MLRIVIFILVAGHLAACATRPTMPSVHTTSLLTTHTATLPPTALSTTAMLPTAQPFPPGTAQITKSISATITFLPNDTNELTNFTFVDHRHGWMMRGPFTWQENVTQPVERESLTTSDGGYTWTKLPAPPFEVKRLVFDSPTHGWAKTPQGWQETSDTGRSWMPVVVANTPFDVRWRNQPGAGDPCGPNTDLLGQPSFLDPQHGWMMCIGDPAAGFESKRLFKTQDGGLTWQMVADSAGTVPGTNLESFGYAGDLHFIDAQHAWMQVGRVGISITEDGGRTWASSPSIVLDSSQVMAIAPVTPEHGFAIVNGSILIETTDGAQTWQQLYPPLHPFGPVFFSDAQHGIGIGTLLDRAATFRTTDGGSTWVPARLSDDEQRELRRHEGGCPATVWRTGNTAWKQDCSAPTQALLRSVDGGASWQPVQLDRKVTSVSATNDVVWVIAYQWEGGANGENIGYLLRSADDGATLKEYRLGERFTHYYIYFIDDQNGWLMTGTLLYRTQDGGKSWTQLY